MGFLDDKRARKEAKAAAAAKAAAEAEAEAGAAAREKAELKARSRMLMDEGHEANKRGEHAAARQLFKVQGSNPGLRHCS